MRLNVAGGGRALQNGIYGRRGRGRVVGAVREEGRRAAALQSSALNWRLTRTHGSHEVKIDWKTDRRFSFPCCPVESTNHLQKTAGLM